MTALINMESSRFHEPHPALDHRRRGTGDRPAVLPLPARDEFERRSARPRGDREGETAIIAPALSLGCPIADVLPATAWMGGGALVDGMGVFCPVSPALCYQ